jgi:hypothetical protein
MEPNRRQLVQAALLTVVWPAVWAGSKRWTPLDQGYRDALSAGEPLLVWLVPEDARERDKRGVLIGAVLNRGSQRTLAALGGCHAACAHPAEVERVFPQVGVLPPDAWFVVLGEQVSIGIIPLHPDWMPHDEAILLGMEAIETTLVDALGEAAAEEQGALAARAQARWVEGVVPGSRWLSYHYGCATGGYRPEKPSALERLGYVAQGVATFAAMCGKAHVSELGSRMLEFY